MDINDYHYFIHTTHWGLLSRGENAEKEEAEWVAIEIEHREQNA
jgi:hypothetical protein